MNTRLVFMNIRLVPYVDEYKACIHEYKVYIHECIDVHQLVFRVWLQLRWSLVNSVILKTSCSGGRNCVDPAPTKTY